MKLQYLFHGLCLLKLIEAQTDAEQFKATCDSQDEQVQTLDSGYKFKFICGKTGVTGNRIGFAQETGTLEDCAALCADNAECKGSMWDYGFKSCQLYNNGDDLQTRRRGIFLRREEESSSADCTAVEAELRECEAAEIVLQDDLKTCQTTQTESQQAHTEVAEKLEACEFERDLCEGSVDDAKKCETENSQITDLTEELQQCTTAALSNTLQLEQCQSTSSSCAVDLQQCQSASSSCTIDLQQCQNNAVSSAIELQQCQSTSSSCALQLQQSQAAASSSANQLQQCQNSASSTATQLQQCQATALSTANQLQQCQATASSSGLELQQCKANAASTTQQLQQCKADTVASAGVPAFNECNAGGNGQIVKIGNRSFKQRCNVSMWKSRMPLRRVVRPGLTRQECALICALDGGCRSVYFVRSTITIGECQLQNENIESKLNQGNADIAYIPV
ncbi:hypothetical protein PEX1_069450 [Penicillium expansum]|uniref:Apple domain-containing protein n=1 Tax=Penicillium expansum TaxID=27334 RepID=A0A0A2K6H7_PENEN|nr:hypothetical protein PEX2_109260 [Penicillium expansum]KGO47188.1 hypothetical protein PEXP_063420 [Penicillium expansum]KGO52274.1 hypothetical protein PEX2_109260 [Penicillium expansum]KGO63449.1 hypothetical protein PEX1_069450 [Penicillium expansum]